MWGKGRGLLLSATVWTRRGESSSQERKVRMLLPREEKAARQGTGSRENWVGSKEYPWEAGVSCGFLAHIWSQCGGVREEGTSDLIRTGTPLEEGAIFMLRPP